MYVCAPCACLVPAKVRRVLDLLKLELQMVVDHHVCAGTQVIYKSNKWSVLTSEPSLQRPIPFTTLTNVMKH